MGPSSLSDFFFSPRWLSALGRWTEHMRELSDYGQSSNRDPDLELLDLNLDLELLDLDPDPATAKDGEGEGEEGAAAEVIRAHPVIVRPSLLAAHFPHLHRLHLFNSEYLTEAWLGRILSALLSLRGLSSVNNRRMGCLEVGHHGTRRRSAFECAPHQPPWQSLLTGDISFKCAVLLPSPPSPPLPSQVKHLHLQTLVLTHFHALDSWVMDCPELTSLELDNCNGTHRISRMLGSLGA